MNVEIIQALGKSIPVQSGHVPRYSWYVQYSAVVYTKKQFYNIYN